MTMSKISIKPIHYLENDLQHATRGGVPPKEPPPIQDTVAEPTQKNLIVEEFKEFLEEENRWSLCIRKNEGSDCLKEPSLTSCTFVSSTRPCQEWDLDQGSNTCP